MEDFQIRKTASLAALRFEPDARDLEQINRYALRPMRADELFVFKAVACDNEIDRDMEAFGSRTLKQMKTLIEGKPVVSDHRWNAGGQCARVYAASVVRDPEKKTSYGAPYEFLETRCYMPRLPDLAGDIAAIEAGIRKEMSICAGIEKETCSICGNDYWSDKCTHTRGEAYDGKTCFVVLEGARDVMELSFVAVPAQRAAGVTKSADAFYACDRKLDGILDAVKSLAREIRGQPDATGLEGARTADVEKTAERPDALIESARRLAEKTLNGGM